MKPSTAAKILPALILALSLTVLGCGSSESSSSGGTESTTDNTASGAVAPQDNTALNEALAAQERRKVKAQALVAEAKELANKGSYTDAFDKYEEALRFDSTNADAASGRTEMAQLINKAAPNAQDANAAIAQREAQGVKARFHYEEGLKARAEGNLDKAVKDLTMAYQLVKYDLLPTTTGLTSDQVKRALDDATMLKDEADRTADARRQEEIRAAQRAEEEMERKRLERRLANLWDNALDRFDAEEFERCEAICDEIIRLDFQNQNAINLKESARRARHAKAQDAAVKNYRVEVDRVLQELRDATVMPTGLLDNVVKFPDATEWRRKIERGERSLQQDLMAESESNREVRAKLGNTVLPKVNWNGKTIVDVATELKAQVGVNIIVTPEAKNAASGELGFELNQVTAERALQAACEALSVTYGVTDGLVKIQTKDELKKGKVIEFYDIGDLVTPIQSFPGVRLNLSGSGVNQSSEEENKDAAEAVGAIETDRLVELIKKAVDPEWDGDDGNKIEPKAGTLIVRQTPERQRLVKRLLNDLRKGTGLQVCIEARFITVENNFLQEIGVDVRGLGNDTVGTGVPGVGRDRTFDDFGATGTGVGTTASPTGIGTGTDTGFNFNDFTETDVRARTENLFDEQLGNPNVLDNSGGASFQFAFLDDTQLEAILRAVQKYERLNTLTAPKLTVYNTQRANLTVLNEIAYIKDFDVEIAQAAVIADPIVDKIREGVVLDVKPIVSHDRRFVTLELRPTVATVVRPIRQFQTQLGVGSAVTLQLPEMHKESVNTTVVVPDGGTLLLGGLKFAEERTLDSKVPFLGDIPVLSFFFSRTGKYTNLKDLLILVKVKIVIVDELEPGNSAGN